jgi:hypothetical protein
MPMPAAAEDEVRKSFIQGGIQTVISPLWNPGKCGFSPAISESTVISPLF